MCLAHPQRPPGGCGTIIQNQPVTVVVDATTLIDDTVLLGPQGDLDRRCYHRLHQQVLESWHYRTVLYARTFIRPMSRHCNPHDICNLSRKERNRKRSVWSCFTLPGAEAPVETSESSISGKAVVPFTGAGTRCLRVRVPVPTHVFLSPPVVSTFRTWTVATRNAQMMRLEPLRASDAMPHAAQTRQQNLSQRFGA